MYKRALLLTVVAVSVLLYQNCAFQGASHEDIPSTFESKGCAAPVATVFYNTYYPVFRMKCVDCHDTGTGFGHFANADFSVAFDAFMSLGRTTVEGNFLNPDHKPGHTGPENQFIVDGARGAFTAAENASASCTSHGSTVTSTDKTNSSIFTAPVVADGSFFHIEWNLETDVDAAFVGRLHLIVGLDVRQLVYTSGGVSTVQGYEFKNPVARLASGFSGSYEIKGLTVLLNRQTLDKVTAYSLMDVTVGAASNVDLLPGGSAAPAVINATPATAASDMFSLRFASILDGSGNAIVGDPTVTTPTNSIPTTVRYSDLLSSNQLLGVFSQNCVSCHNGVSAAAGLNLANFTQAKAKAATIQSRMNNGGAPMPPSGLLPAISRQVVDVWVNGGAPQ